jgi:hypothetical protein
MPCGQVHLSGDVFGGPQFLCPGSAEMAMGTSAWTALAEPDPIGAHRPESMPVSRKAMIRSFLTIVIFFLRLTLNDRKIYHQL